MRKNPRSSLLFSAALVWVLPLFILLACQTGRKSAPEKKSATGTEALPPEVSLKADRSQLDKEREGVAPEVRRENDELALILQMMSVGSPVDQEPLKIRDRFNTYLRKKRDKNDEILRKRRDEFSKQEKAKRDQFLSGLKEERDSFQARKGTSARDRQSYFSNEEKKRAVYFADERDKTKDFESGLNDERRTFEDEARQLTNKFNEELHTYTQAFYDRRNAEAVKKSNEVKERKAKSEAAQKPFLDEFKAIPKGPSTPLGPSGE